MSCRFENTDSGSGRVARAGAESGRRGRPLGLAIAATYVANGIFKDAKFCLSILGFFGTLESFSEGKRLRSKDAKKAGTLEWNGSEYFRVIVSWMEQWILQVGLLQFGHVGQIGQIGQHEKHTRRVVAAFRIEKSCRTRCWARAAKIQVAQPI
jgi:hypothetical protein